MLTLIKVVDEPILGDLEREADYTVEVFSDQLHSYMYLFHININLDNQRPLPVLVRNSE